MKRLLIAGDSLSMSRYVDGVEYSHMYSSLLTASFPGRLIVNASERSNSSDRIASKGYMEEYLYPMKPDVVILQVGVVDCFPRIFSNFQRRVVGIASNIRWTKSLAGSYVDYVSKRRFQVTKKRLISLVPIGKFERNLRLIKEVATSGNTQCRFIVINIPCPGRYMTEKSFGIDEVVRDYNDVLNNVYCGPGSELVDLYSATRNNPSLLLGDGYHINAQGHSFLFCAMRGVLNEWLF